jgi:hypothetical protein
MRTVEEAQLSELLLAKLDENLQRITLCGRTPRGGISQ